MSRKKKMKIVEITAMDRKTAINMANRKHPSYRVDEAFIVAKTFRIRMVPRKK